MSKSLAKYEIKEWVSGSFVGASGRLRYELEAGIVSEKDLDPEVLARLIAAGKAVRASKPTASKESA
jgi:hypothetical protein